MPHRLPPGAVQAFLALRPDPEAARVLDRFEKYLSIYPEGATYDARSTLPKTLQTPEQGYLQTGGTKLTAPADHDAQTKETD